MRKRRPSSAMIALLACLWHAAPALALECPTPQPLAKPGVLAETPAEIAQAGKTLSSGDVMSQALTIVADLRKRYPRAESAEIANYLIAAYCPVVAAKESLSEPEKKASMDAFVSRLMKAIY